MAFDGMFNLSCRHHRATIGNLLKQFHFSDKYADTWVAACGRRIPAHKIVLGAVSPYLKELLNIAPPDTTIILADTSFLELQNILKFIYEGEVQTTKPESLRINKALKRLGICLGGLDFSGEEEDEKAPAAEHVDENMEGEPQEKKKDFKLKKLKIKRKEGTVEETISVEAEDNESPPGSPEASQAVNGVRACSKCSEEFDVEFNQTLHEESNCGEYPLECSQCSETLDSFLKHASHKLRKHHFKRDRGCPGCEKAFTGPATLVEHYSNFHFPDHMLTHKCHVCKRKFVTRQHLLRHMLGYHRIKAEEARAQMPKNARICSICKRYFKGKTDYFSHKNQCFKNHFRLRCAFCGEKFSSQGELKNHRRDCIPDPYFKLVSDGKYECRTCSTITMRKSMAQHYKICSLKSGRVGGPLKKKKMAENVGKFRIRCVRCKVDFRNRDVFLQHLSSAVTNHCAPVHFFEKIDENVAKCILCHNEVSSKTSNRAAHIGRCITWLHCALCQKNVPFLSKHFEECHVGVDPSPYMLKNSFNGEEKFEVPVETLGLTTNPLSGPKKYKATSDPDFFVRCGICKERFSTKSDLIEHRDTCVPRFFDKTENGYFKCKKCEHTIVFARNLYTHLSNCKDSKIALEQEQAATSSTTPTPSTPNQTHASTPTLDGTPTVEPNPIGVPMSEERLGRSHSCRICGVCRLVFQTPQDRNDHHVLCLAKYFEATTPGAYRCKSCGKPTSISGVSKHTYYCQLHREALSGDGIAQPPLPHSNSVPVKKTPVRYKTFGARRSAGGSLCGVCRKVFPDKMTASIHRRECIKMYFELLSDTDIKCKLCSASFPQRRVSEHVLKCPGLASSINTDSGLEAEVKTEPEDGDHLYESAANFEESLDVFEPMAVEAELGTSSDSVASQITENDDAICIKVEPNVDDEMVYDVED